MLAEPTKPLLYNLLGKHFIQKPSTNYSHKSQPFLESIADIHTTDLFSSPSLVHNSKTLNPFSPFGHGLQPKQVPEQLLGSWLGHGRSYPPYRWPTSSSAAFRFALAQHPSPHFTPDNSIFFFLPNSIFPLCE